jgi:ribose/xylose/arabinose/galactoside ABC-type transport system permease subunit
MSDTPLAAPAPALAPMPSASLGQRLMRSEGVRFVLPLLIAIVAISLYTNNKNSRFITFDNFQSIFLQVAVLGIIAIGQTFLIVAGQLDLSVGALAALAGVIGAARISDGGSEMWAVVLVLLICVAIGSAWGLLVAGLRIPPFILTLGGLSLFTSFALRISKSVPVPARDHFDWLGRHKILGLTTPVWFFLLITAVAALVMRYTRFGRHVYATGSAEEAAYLAGIPTARTKVLCFVISSTLAGFAGLIGMARISAGDPRVGSSYALQAIAAIVLGGATLAGGRGSPLGTFVGVVLLGVVQAALTFNNVATFWNDAVFGGVLIFAVIVTAIGDLRRNRSTGRSTLKGLVSRPPDRATVTTPTGAAPVVQPAETSSVGSTPGETPQ